MDQISKIYAFKEDAVGIVGDIVNAVAEGVLGKEEKNEIIEAANVSFSTIAHDLT